jgi:hypothetical protein
VLGIEARGQAMQAQGFAGAGLVDHQRGDAALGQPAGQADQVFHFLGRIQAIELDQHRAGPCTLWRGIQARDDLAFIRNFDALAVLASQRDAALEHLQEAPVQFQAARCAVPCRRSQVSR